MEKDYLPINPTPISEAEALQKNANVLAFIGDAVQTLYSRTKVSDMHDYTTGTLHRKVAKEVCAKAQAKAIKAIIDGLNELEIMVYKRSRNVTKPSKSKNADSADYNIASGFEGLIGFLYLIGNHDRLKELLEKAYELNNPPCVE
ncbi:MAG: ribonuclease III domain-containing protein [Christensenellales bacterium]|jgi:ribonuclease-3 family protein|nr:Mini-ribonuclease 3 [Clostridiales bacterium]